MKKQTNNKKLISVFLLTIVTALTFSTLNGQDVTTPPETVTTVPDMVKILSKGNPKEFDAAITAGGDINSSDPDGKTLLMLAVEKNRSKQFDSLVLAGADLNRRDLTGKTLLHYIVTSLCRYKHCRKCIKREPMTVALKDSTLFISLVKFILKEQEGAGYKGMSKEAAFYKYAATAGSEVTKHMWLYMV